MKETQDADAQGRVIALRKFLHDVAAPLSALSLELETASRAASRGEDPSEALALAQQTLERVFALFERGRATLLGGASGDRTGSAT